MVMSRKIYQQVAEVISGEYKMHLDPEMTVAGAQSYILQGVASQLAWMFSQDNPSFDRNKFMQACFPEVGNE